MIPAIAISLLMPVAAPARVSLRSDDPPIRVKLSDDAYERGDRARVKVRLQKDGYLLVLRLDGDGRVRVLFPLSPDDTDRVRGGREFEVRGRGDREAFVVDERQGPGTVLAARSDEPFNFDDFARNGRWDYRALAPAQHEDDAETTLLDLVDRMTSGRYDYDLVSYAVTPSQPSRYYAGWYWPWYGPWYYGYYPYYPWFYGPRVGVRIGIGFGRGHFVRGRR